MLRLYVMYNILGLGIYARSHSQNPIQCFLTALGEKSLDIA